MSTRWFALAAVCLCAVGCVRAVRGTAESPSVEAAGASEPAPPELPPPPPVEVTRDEPAREYVPRKVVDEILEADLGQLLGRVQVEPAREDGTFVGYRVVALDPAFEGGPVQVEDIVVRLNGMNLQTPDAAQRALDTLAVATEVVVEVIRDGEPTRTHLAIR